MAILRCQFGPRGASGNNLRRENTKLARCSSVRLILSPLSYEPRLAVIVESVECCRIYESVNLKFEFLKLPGYRSSFG